MVEKLVIKAAPPTGTFDLAAAIASKPLLTPLAGSEEFIVRRPADNALFRVAPATIAAFVGVAAPPPPPPPPTSAPLPFKNVFDFGAKGDGINDDAPAVRAATAAGNKCGTVFFPAKTYIMGSSVPFELGDGYRSIRFLGDPGAKLLGGFPDAMLKRSPNTPVAGVCSIENLDIENNHPRGKGIMFHSLIGGEISNCKIAAWRGIETFNSQSVLIRACSLVRTGAHDPVSSVGIVAGNATAIVACDVVGYENGVRHSNAGLFIAGGRYEMNLRGIALGLSPGTAADDFAGEKFQTSSFTILGPSMEANQIAIEISAAAAGQIQFSCGGGIPMQSGLRIWGCNDVVVLGSSISGSAGFSAETIVVEGANRLVFIAVSAPSWKLPPTGVTRI